MSFNTKGDLVRVVKVLHCNIRFYSVQVHVVLIISIDFVLQKCILFKH